MKEAIMRGKLMKVVMALIASVMALAFYAVPIVKLKEGALVVVVLIGVAAMIYSFVDFVREED
jgi:hypothetical protein